MTDTYDDEAGEQIVRALRSSAAAPVRSALIGCLFYSVDPEQAELITDASSDAPILITCRDGRTRRLPYGLLEQGYVIPNAPGLRAALAAARTPRDEQMDQAAAILARERVNPPLLPAIASRLPPRFRKPVLACCPVPHFDDSATSCFAIMNFTARQRGYSKDGAPCCHPKAPKKSLF